MSTPAHRPARRPVSRPGARFRLPITAALTGLLGLLLLSAAGGILAVAFGGASRNTGDLLQERAAIGLELLESRLRGLLAPVEVLGAELVALVAAGAIDPGRPGDAEKLRLAMAGVPQVTAAVFVAGPDGPHAYRTLQYSRTGGMLGEVVERGLDLAGLGGMADSMEALQAMLDSAADMDADHIWLPPLWVQDLGQPVLALESPVWRGDRFLGVVLVVVGLGDLAGFLAELEAEKMTSAFILYDKTHVLAHPALVSMMDGVPGRELPLPSLDGFDEPAFALIGRGVTTRLAASEGVDYAYADSRLEVTLRDLTGLGTHPWQIGLKFPADERGMAERRLRASLLAGLAILLLAAVATFFVGRALARPMHRLTRAAERIAALDLDGTPPLPDSRFRELARVAVAFNAMAGALRWFERYVPGTLVRRLIAAGGHLASEERQVTVMFTDIVGFTALAEPLSAGDVAGLLNRHFACLARCVEAHGGTVDKFIGDSLMAFWGAPEAMADHAARAVAAARDIREAIRADNADRAGQGLAPVRLRLGLHTGPAVVGNIGPDSRLNYTIVGDTVNIAARIEQLGKTAPSGDDVVVLASGATVGTPPAAGFVPVGERVLKGRAAAVSVYMLPSGRPGHAGPGDQPAASGATGQ